MKDQKNKKTKSKTVYVDDGRSISDMSGLYSSRPLGRSPSSLKAQFKTYIDTVKLMIVPMFITLGIIAAAFLLLYIIL